jgi:Spy/CpxP family protein refolding chaperone
MTTENNTPETSETKPAAASGWGKWVAVGAVAAMLVGGAGIANAVSDEGARNFKRFGFEQSESMGQRHGGGFMKAHMGFGGRGVDRVLNAIDATDEQSDKIYAILDEARGEVRPMMREFRDTREDLIEILSAETIDRQALETLRTERVAALDEASKSMSETLLEVADVLTAEQRAKIIEHLQERGRGRW